MPPGWQYPEPPPPIETNGWGRFVAARLEHLLWRVHQVEQELRETRALIRPVSDADSTKPPSEKEIWVERKEVAKEVATGLKWLAAVVLLIALIFKKIEPSQIPAIKSLIGLGG